MSRYSVNANLIAFTRKVMRKHIIAIASIYLLLGTTIAILFINGHIHFFSLNSSFFSEPSVINDDYSLFQKASSFYNSYRNFFEQFDINPLFSLFTIISSFSFGYGLLKSKEWARKLGFVLVALNAFSSIYTIFYNSISAVAIIQLGLAAYMWWVLTSEKAKNLMKPELDENSLALSEEKL